MRVHIFDASVTMAAAAAGRAADLLAKTIGSRGQANLILATGASQFEMLENLVHADVPWDKVTIFHLDEYIGLPESHPASFRKYLRERVVNRLPSLGRFVPVVGDAPDPAAECARLGALISQVDVDVACIGIGENGHLAFNDPPADFDTQEPYLVVELDEACRRQQMGEGWFPTVNDVPARAISMSVAHILKSAAIVCTVPDERKAEAVLHTLEGPVTPSVPASALQNHGNCDLYLDAASAGKLSKPVV
ncbi:MAG: glucosamine-6-phosphate deaminase [Anaerolineae bacterium]|jgi:glucosamine-6-phosphate deaminase|nr:glucosamine-6-phosphate deaminase [Chloroflexota bacterium]